MNVGGLVLICKVVIQHGGKDTGLGLVGATLRPPRRSHHVSATERGWTFGSCRRDHLFPKGRRVPAITDQQKVTLRLSVVAVVTCVMNRIF